MSIDAVSATAKKGYEQRVHRQALGIAKAKQKGVYKGRPVDQDKHEHIRDSQNLDKGCTR